MNEKTLKLLEFDNVRLSVAACALSEEAGTVILNDKPRLTAEETDKLKSLTAAVAERMLYSAGENRESLPDIGQLFSKLDVEGAVLEIDEAYAIGIFINRAEAFKQWLQKPYKPLNEIPRTQCPILPIVQEFPVCSDISTGIFKIIDKEGNLRDLPEFREIRKKIRSLQRDIEKTGSRYASNDETRRMLQSDIPSQRDGRLVLAVKANFRGRIRGIVHELSSSGQTIFVEPEEVVEKNNELLIENRRLEAEIRKVMRELSARIAEQREKLKLFYEGIIFIETIRARARYGFERRNVFAFSLCETNNPAAEKLILKQARHPLLGKGAVPLDLFMEGGIRTVIITGPNTGGKTVALKTLGLLAMMNQFGLALPAEEGTLLPVFDGIYADIGDEQSLSQSLSTFSAHMTNIADIIERTTDRSLVLLDELGSGTDPEEGSAIAMAILDHFIEVKARLIVTTHHGVLKNYGYTREGVENASMEFDSRTLSPTYKIVMGIPGESRAMDIAARNGFPAALVSRARSYLDEERSDVSALITGLKEKHRELDAAAESGKEEEKRLLEKRRLADLKELRLRQKELQLQADGASNLKSLLSESRKTLENLVRELKEAELTGQSLGRDKTLKVKEFLSGLEAKVQAEEAELEKERLTLAAERSRIEADSAEDARQESTAKKIVLKPGLEVLAGESRRRGRILRLDRKGSSREAPSWIVEIGSLKMSFPQGELIPVSSSAKPNARTGSAGNNTWSAELAPAAPARIELNLLGMRLSDALEALGRQIDAAVLSSLTEFSVVHGLGDGILSKGVHDFLKKDPRVTDYHFSRPEVGGFGRTEVQIR